MASPDTPVIVNRDCPGQRDMPPADAIAGRVTITWPAASAPTTAISPSGITTEDPDTGEQLLDVVSMRMSAKAARGADLTVDLERLVDIDGKPIGRGKPVPSDDGRALRTGVFRYYVAEMHVADREHKTVNELRADVAATHTPT